jgi:hypothetical protein
MLYRGNRMDDVVNAAGVASGAAGKVAAVAVAGLTLAVIVVMTMTLPPSRREFLVAMVSTVAIGVGGTAGIVMYYNLQHMAYSFWGLTALGSLFFVCGLPGWVIIRAVFITAEKMKGKGLGEIISEVRGWTK